MRQPTVEIPDRPQPPLRIAISDCLLGQEVRYDGGHKRSSYPHTVLDPLFDYAGICPEVGVGMGVPRDPIRLVASDTGAARAVGIDDPAVDMTDALVAYAAERIPDLTDVDGYVFTRSSPSCGLFRVKVYPQAGGAPAADGRGVYARAVCDALPQLPVEENGRLNDAVLRENFVTRVFVHAHWRALQADGLSAAKLIEFHSRYKYLLMAHDQEAYRRCGRLLSDLSEDIDARASPYFAELMRGLAHPASRGRHANVLSHLQGYLKRHIDGAERQELEALIRSYAAGEVPLLAPLTLLRHHFRRHPDTYVLAQVYLEPHPQNAGLRRSL